MPQLLEEVDRASLVFQSFTVTVDGPDGPDVVSLGRIEGRANVDVYAQASIDAGTSLRGALLVLVAVVGSTRTVVAFAPFPGADFVPIPGIGANLPISFRGVRPAAWEIYLANHSSAIGTVEVSIAAWGREAAPSLDPVGIVSWAADSTDPQPTWPADGLADALRPMTVKQITASAASGVAGVWFQVWDAATVAAVITGGQPLMFAAYMPAAGGSIVVPCPAPIVCASGVVLAVSAKCDAYETPAAVPQWAGGLSVAS